MTDYEAEAYVATYLLLEVCSSTKLFGHLHGENLLLANDVNNCCDLHTVGILHEPDVKSLDTLENDLELHRP